MASAQNIVTAVLRTVRDEAIIGNFQKIPYWDALKRYGGITTQSGGRVQVHPLTVGEHNAVQAFKGAGYEPQNLAFKNILEEMYFEWATFASYIGISKKEKTRNKGEQARIDILSTRLKNVMHMQMRELSKRTLTGYSNSSEYSELLTWNGHSSVDTTGFFEEDARASQTNNVGNHTRSGVDALQNQRANGSNDASANILNQQDELKEDCDLKAPVGGIDAIFCSKEYRRHTRRALRDAERYVDATTIDHDVKLAVGGAPLIVDIEMPAVEGTQATGTDEFSAYFINFQLMKTVFEEEGQFALGEYERVSGFFVEAAPLYTELQNVTLGLAGCGLHYNIHTY